MAEPVPYAPAMPGGAKPFQPQLPGAQGPLIKPYVPGMLSGQGQFQPQTPAPQPSKPWFEQNLGSGSDVIDNLNNPWNGMEGAQPPQPKSFGPPSTAQLHSALQLQGPQQGTGIDGEGVGDPNPYKGGLTGWAGRKLDAGVDAVNSLHTAVFGDPTKMKGGLGINLNPEGRLPAFNNFLNRTNPLGPNDTLGNLERHFNRNTRPRLKMPALPDEDDPASVAAYEQAIKARDNPPDGAPVTEALGISDYVPHPLDLAAASKAPALIRGGANLLVKGLPAAGAAVRRMPSWLGGIARNEPVLGVGAATNTVGGLKDMALGTVRRDPKLFGVGLSRAGLKAPLQTIGPTTLAGVASQTRPGAESEPANKWMSPEGAAGQPYLPPNQIAAGIGSLKKTFGLTDDPTIPTIPEAARAHFRNVAHVGDMAVRNWPAFQRGVGNAADDIRYRLAGNTGSPTPQRYYADLENKYLANQAMANSSGQNAAIGGLLPGSLAASDEDIRNQVAQLNYPTKHGPDIALRNLARDEIEKLYLQREQEAGRAVSPESQANLAKYLDVDYPRNNRGLPITVDNKQVMPYPTARDIEAARIRAGLDFSGNQAAKRDEFNRTVAAQVPPTASLAPGAPPPNAGLASPQTPTGDAARGVTPGGFNPETAEMVHKVLAGTMISPMLAVQGSAVGAAEAGRGVSSLISSASQSLKSVFSTAGGLSGAIQAAAKSPTPEAFGAVTGMAALTPGGAPEATSELGKYWQQLPPSSRILAIAGLSITAISALRSMFSSGDGKDDDESFLMKVLPYLGLGAAAWGLGGGTLGFSKENLPSMGTYKQLGNAVTGSLGMGKLLN